MSLTPAQLARFLRKTKRDDSGCLLWTGWRRRDGYGVLGLEWQYRRAHRVYFEHVNGPIPPGMDLDHLCRVRNCVNPEHLRIATRRENVLAPGSLSVAKAHSEKIACPKGHPYSGRDNRGGRVCHACDSERHRSRRPRKDLEANT